MWNETDWGPMMHGGWWFMPLIGILFMVIVIFLLSRFFGTNGGMCRRHNRPEDVQDIFAEIRREIHELRMEIKELRDQNKINDVNEEGS